MNSVIIWVLVITMNGGYCAESASVKFTTEAECEKARSGLDSQHKMTSRCEPRKDGK